jgi:hypothetical protein
VVEHLFADLDEEEKINDVQDETLLKVFELYGAVPMSFAGGGNWIPAKPATEELDEYGGLALQKGKQPPNKEDAPSPTTPAPSAMTLAAVKKMKRSSKKKNAPVLCISVADFINTL